MAAQRLVKIGVFVGFIAWTQDASAQTARVTGIITDATAGVLPGADVTAANAQTGVSSSVVSNRLGEYTIAFLQPGTYRVEVQLAGFRPAAREGVTLTVGQVARLDFVLTLARVQADTVVVEGRAPLIDKETSTLGSVIDSQRVENLPLLGRNPYALVALVPGARPSAGLNQLPVDQISTSSASINGSRGNQNEYLLDGAPNTVSAQNQPAIYPSADAVQEFRVETNNYSAEYGRAGGGIFNVVTKSGTNTVRGSAFEYLRHDRFEANNFFANRAGREKPPFRFNQFGGTIGGPVVLGRLYNGRNRSFVFASYEGARLRQGVTYLGTVPTALQRRGDFRQTLNAQGQRVTIYDPFTTRPDPNNPGRFLRTPFLDNVIPSDRIDPVTRSVLELIPLPNLPGDPRTGVNNYISTASQQIHKDMLSIRGDHHISQRHRVFGRFSYDRTPWTRPDVYGSVASPAFGPQVFTRRNIALDDLYTLGQGTLLNTRYSWSSLDNVRTPLSFGYDLATLGFPAGLSDEIGLRALPAFLVTGMGGSFSQPNVGVGSLVGVNDLIDFKMGTHAVLGTLTKAVGRHTVKSGVDLRVYRLATLQHPDTGNNFSFGPAFTQGPDPARASATAGYGFAAFLLGTGAGAVQVVPRLNLQQIYYGAFVQDDFKVTSRLTLNVGVRYDYETPRTEASDQLTNFDAGVAPPLQVPGLSLRGVLTFVGKGAIPRAQWNPDRANIAPRLGFAFQLSDRTVMRGGGGLFYAPTTGVGATADVMGASGFEANTAFVGTLDGVSPFRLIRNPYPDGITQPSGSAQGPATLLGQTVNFAGRDFKTPVLTQWNIGVQRELPKQILVEAGYAGSRGRHLMTNVVLNQLPPEALRLGGALRELVPNPLFGQILSGPISDARVSRGQLLRPYPHFNQVTSVNATWGRSNYHALVTKVEKRARGVNFMASYSFSRLDDNVTGPFSGEALGAAGVQNWNDLGAEYARSALDAPHRLVLSYILELPFGEGHRALSSGVVGKLLGGWQVNGITSFQSGVPLGISTATNTTFAFGGGQRPNLLRDPRLPSSERSVERWFDTAAFAQPEPYTFGDAPRTIPGLRADGEKNTDLGITKRTRVNHRLSIELRAELFNLFNTTRFNPPNLAFGSPGFGVISSQANSPRITQFGLRLSF
jgi:hypothetical protein